MCCLNSQLCGKDEKAYELIPGYARPSSETAGVESTPGKESIMAGNQDTWALVPPLTLSSDSALSGPQFHDLPNKRAARSISRS